MIRNIIKEYRLAIASSRGRPSIIEYLQAFGIEDCFSILIGGSDVSHGKPSPEPVNKILEACGWEASETLTVGDAPVDIFMGRNAGTKTCAVTYGNATEEELRAAAPDHIIPDFTQILDII